MWSKFLTAGLILSWMLTPEVLVMVNRGAGLTGIYIVFSLAAGTMLALFCSFIIHNPRLLQAGFGSDLLLMQSSYGKVASAALILAGRIPLLLFASIGMLVTAGFAFNEIFVYWFPNFLFASLLLVAITVFNLGHERYALGAQAVAATTVIIGLVTLIVLGFWQDPLKNIQISRGAQSITPSLILLGSVSLLGFDFHQSAKRDGAVGFTLVMGGVLLSLWSLVALRHVAGQSLADSPVAYMFVARSIAGDFGRQIMGIVVISGVFCGVNGLLVVFRRILRDFSVTGLYKRNTAWTNLIVIVFMLTIETLMITGFAGEVSLKYQIRAAITLWLLYLGLRTLAAGRALQQSGYGDGWLGYPLAAIVLAIGMLLGGYGADRLPEMKLLLLFLSLSLLVSYGLNAFAARKSKSS